MPKITLPDGSTRQFDEPVSALALASDIGAGLAKAALGAVVDGELCDLSTIISEDAEVAIVTPGRKGETPDPHALFLMRHSTAHVMAEAIQRIFPGTALVYGPPVDEGFYYDMRLPEGVSMSVDDFEAIETQMAAIVQEDRSFTRFEMGLDEGMEKLSGEGSKYKIDNAQRAADAGSTSLSWYATGVPGDDWEDLCRGPHVPSTGRIGAFKVLSLASSYWHGDANSDRLLRVYGTSFPDKKQLDHHMQMLQEARDRDHRVVGRRLGLFHIDEAVGPGLILWTPKGSIVRQELQDFISRELRRQGYDQVFTPHIGKLDLYRTSGHYPYYQESQFPPLIEPDVLNTMATEGCSCADLASRMAQGDIDGYLLKPMNCPHHIKIYSSTRHSYRELPIRLAEFGTVYRWEQSGEIGGMTRVRGFTQDDAHIFCTQEQVAEELIGCLELVKIIFATLKMEDFTVRVGLRDADSSKYVGDPEKWDLAEQACREAAATLGVPFTEDAGEAAFYGPKIDFIMRDVVGRQWQLGTVQVDYNLPERFDLTYIGADNAAHRPVMIHRAPFGSMERFIGVLIEHFAGAFPTWLSPEQVRVLPISDKSLDYATEVWHRLTADGVRATLDSGGERIQARIRTAAESKVPWTLVVGPRDAQNRTVSVRALGIQQDLGAIDLDAFASALSREISTRGGESVLAACFPDSAS